MIARYLVAAALALAPHTAAAQAPTLAKVHPVLTEAEKALGQITTPPKTWAEWTRRYQALPAAIRAGAVIAAPDVKPGEVDPAFYLASNADVKAAGVDPAQHYRENGRWEGRLPYKGAKAWRPNAATPQVDYPDAPACKIEVANAWVPAGASQIRVRFKLTRYGDGTPCERSASVIPWASNSTREDAGYPTMNISGQPVMIAVDDALALPSQGSQGELVFNVPEWARGTGFRGWFEAHFRTAEYNPRGDATFKVYVGGTQPAGTQYHAAPLVLPAATPYPADLGKPAFETRFQDLAGWRFSPGSQLNGMIGVFTTPNWKTASGKPTDNYPLVNGVRHLVLRDHRSDPAGGKYLFSAPMISRLLGDGIYGYRLSDIDLPPAYPGSDAALWGIKPDGSWPPEFDTHEGFASNPGRLTQTIHMPRNGAPTIGFIPRVNWTGRHEWLEEFGRQTYRLWIDRKLVVERPNYLAGTPFETTLSIEGPGGAGGPVDLSQPYDGMAIKAHWVAWWQG